MQLTALKQKKETDNCFSLIFQKPENFFFYPGQYLDIELPVKDPLGKTRIFSLSSSPAEDFIMITYNKGVSEFKKSLEKINSGELISSSHPAGTVVMDENSPVVMMAGGIGIAPHRSMIKWALANKFKLPVTLIYSNSDENFIFKKELDSWKTQLPDFKLHYIVTSEEGRLNVKKLKKILPLFPQDPIYYLAGPPSLVDDFEKMLLELGVDKTNIRTDRFDGYE